MHGRSESGVLRRLDGTCSVGRGGDTPGQGRSEGGVLGQLDGTCSDNASAHAARPYPLHWPSCDGCGKPNLNRCSRCGLSLCRRCMARGMRCMCQDAARLSGSWTSLGTESFLLPITALNTSLPVKACALCERWLCSPKAAGGIYILQARFVKVGSTRHVGGACACLMSELAWPSPWARARLGRRGVGAACRTSLAAPSSPRHRGAHLPRACSGCSSWTLRPEPRRTSLRPGLKC